MNLQINDILYTKDGRKSGNLTVVDIKQVHFFVNSETTFPKYICMSDYGNRVETYLGVPGIRQQFYAKPGKATASHKYFNYKQSYPEEFI